MSEHSSIIKKLFALVYALLPEDWRGRAGKRFRETTEAISTFADQHGIHPRDLASEGLELTRTALTGKANKDLAAVVKDFADGEHTKIQTELLKRSAPTEARRNEAAARLAELQVLHSEADLLKKIRQLGVVLRCDERGNLTVLPAPKEVCFEELAHRRLLAAGEDHVLDLLVEQFNADLVRYQIIVTMSNEVKPWVLNSWKQNLGIVGLRQAWFSLVEGPLTAAIAKGTISPGLLEVYLEGGCLFCRQSGGGTEGLLLFRD